MRLLRNIIIALILVIPILISCGFTEITDLIHKDTEEFHIGEGYNFSQHIFDQYQINEILFVPYTRHNPEQNYNQKFSTYSLRLALYKQKENNGKVVINYITVEGIKDVKFDKITKVLNKSSEFSDYENYDNIQIGEVILIDEMNNYNMELNDKSQIKVVLNVSIEENRKTITRDLVYNFETRIKKYLVQP